MTTPDALAAALDRLSHALNACGDDYRKQARADLALIRAALARQARLVAVVEDREALGRLLYEARKQASIFARDMEPTWANADGGERSSYRDYGGVVAAALLAALDAPEGAQP